MATSAMDTFRAAVEGRVQAAWVAAGYPVEALTFAGTSFSPPAGTTVWARMTILWGMGSLLTQGSGIGGAGDRGANEVAGVVHVAAFQPAETGYGDANRAVDVLRDALNRAAVGAGQLLVPSGPVPVENGDDPAWVQVVCAVPFQLIDAL